MRGCERDLDFLILSSIQEKVNSRGEFLIFGMNDKGWGWRLTEMNDIGLLIDCSFLLLYVFFCIINVYLKSGRFGFHSELRVYDNTTVICMRNCPRL